MNIAKLKKLKRWILSEPRRYNQNTWFEDRGSFVEEQKPPCGTVACLAGSACLMEGIIPKPGVGPNIVLNMAQKILGLTSAQAYGLFYSHLSGWSQKARIAYQSSPGPNGRALAAAMELDRLIKQGSRKTTKRR